MDHSKLVVVQAYSSRAEADLAKGALKVAGIESMIKADTAGGMREHLAWAGAGFQILVREEDATAAKELLMSPVDPSEFPNADLQSDEDAPTPWRKFT
jgi:hypothetical protein